MFFGNSGAKIASNTSTGGLHFLRGVISGAYITELMGASLQGSIIRERYITLNNFLKETACLTRICRSNVAASVNVSMKPVFVLPKTFSRETLDL